MKILSRHISIFSLVIVAITNNFAFADEEKQSLLKFNGALRGNFQYLDYNPNRQVELEFDTLRGGFTYDNETFFSSGQLRFYRYSDTVTGGTKGGEMIILQHLWGGYRFEDKSELIAGFHSHPFGITPYAGNNFFESIAYYAGLEDAQSLGLKYSRKDGDLETQVAFYPHDGGHGWANEQNGNYLEQESARYSFHAVNGNEERNTAMARITYTVQHSNDIKSVFGVSYMNGEINSTIGQNGRKDATAVHYIGTFGNVGVKLEAINYDYRLANSPQTIHVGAFGFSNNLATKGNIYMANVSYAFDFKFGIFSGFTVYNDYSVLDKRITGFNDSRENVTGVSFNASKVFVYVDYMQGKNSTYMSPQFTNGLGSGAVTNNDGTRLNINIGYYF